MSEQKTVEIGGREYELPFKYETSWRFGDSKIVDSADTEFCYPEDWGAPDAIGETIVKALNQYFGYRTDGEKAVLEHFKN